MNLDSNAKNGNFAETPEELGRLFNFGWPILIKRIPQSKNIMTYNENMPSLRRRLEILGKLMQKTTFRI